MCHEPTSVGLPQSLGVGKGTVLLEDFDKADAILIFGPNPGTNSPGLMTPLRDAARRGAAILSFNPFRERALERFQSHRTRSRSSLTSTPITSRFFQVRVGGDAAALKGMMKACIAMDDAAVAADEARLLDVNFIQGHTKGYEALAEDLRATSWPAIERASGLTQAELEDAGRTYLQRRERHPGLRDGLTQHHRGTENVRLLTNLALLRGKCRASRRRDLPGARPLECPGNRTVGITEKPTTEFLDRLRAAFGFEPPRHHGHDTVQAIEAMQAGRIRAFVALGGNFATADPDTNLSQRVMRNLDLTVTISTKSTAATSSTAGSLHPALPRPHEVDVQASGPQSITVEDSMVDGARLGRPQRAGFRASAQRERDRGRSRAGDARIEPGHPVKN